MATPKSKSEILTLIDTYIPSTGYPNIRAAEHREIETAILDRVDGRILKTGTFSIVNFNAYTTRTINFTPPLYTNKYIVMVTPVSGTPNTMATHRATFTITGRTTSQFTILLQPNSGTYNARFWYAVFSKEPL